MGVDDGPLLHRGSCICDEYELRITERCLVEDFGLSSNSSFEEALKHPIVQSFVEKRKDDPGSGKTVGPAAGKKTLYHLGRGHDHRGATWFDRRNGVVWLCGYGLHRSGEPDDAFQIFQALIEADQIRPKNADYRRLGRDRVGRLVELGPDHGEASVKQAVAELDEIKTISLAGQVSVRVAARVIDDILEVCIAFPWKDLNHDQILFVVRCFAGSSNDMWENSGTLADQPLAEGELGFTIWREA